MELRKKQILTVAIQGIRGSFHELAAIKFFSAAVSCIECASFKDVFRLVKNVNTVFGITAIENTVAGTILPSPNAFKLLGEYKQGSKENLLPQVQLS